MNKILIRKRSARTYPSRSLHGSIVHELGKRIVSGAYEAGETLPVEEVLRMELSVSRNALREAVKVLSAKGLLRVKTRIGTQVQPREKWHLTDNVPGARERAFPVHLRIGQAVIDGRSADARAAMLELFELLSEDVANAFCESK